MSDKSIEKNWDKIISSKRNFFSLDLNRVWEYRDLIKLFVKRDFISYYKQTIFGPIWYLVQPILSTIMYMVIFGTLANLGTDEIPQILFYFLGTMLWSYFSGNIKDVSNTFTANKSMFSKVFFPRIIAPIASTVGLLIKLGIQFALFIILYLVYIFKGMEVNINWTIFLFPFIIIWISFLSCGIGMIISSITTKYRDLALVLDFLISLWMYATPIVYPLSNLPKSLFIVACINPISAPVELFRAVFFGVSSIPTYAIYSSAISTIIIFLLGILMFNKNEKSFIDVI